MDKETHNKLLRDVTRKLLATMQALSTALPIPTRIPSSVAISGALIRRRHSNPTSFLQQPLLSFHHHMHPLTQFRLHRSHAA